ncbi:hypothetical protein JCGZ_06419 [Jatropha curcas]|uniref:Protein kinase domain-containing protein n=1 Tax=Jatropha curcas TaxID=180498 RepID=A0A067JC66_JATCU|nr:uncharacterized protein LOC105650377 [Jatropha curcas]KDP20333.1 hypothetical protein JCGZ_06419 [Jatropha curcas]
MIRESPGGLGQQFYVDTAKVLSNDRYPEDRHHHDDDDGVCAQTGEEFSTEFLRDRIALRRVADHSQLIHMTSNYNQHHQMVYEDLSNFHGIWRKNSGLDALDFVSRAGHPVELDHRAYPDHMSRCQWEYSGSGQNPVKYTGEMNTDRLNPPLKYAAESHPSYHPYGTDVMESSFLGKMKFLCSFGGKILPRPSDGKLRYVGGETRIISIKKTVKWDELARKTLAICNQPHTIKYQLPGEDLDALISVCSNEDLHHMMEEYRELERNGGSQRLRIFLIPSGEPDSPNSFEGKILQQNDQYVVAVNGRPDLSPMKTRQPMQLGTNSDIYAFDSKDSSQTSAFASPALRVLTKVQNPGTPFNQSPPLSPVTIRHGDHKNSNMHFYVDRSYPEGNETTSPLTMDKSPFDNSFHPHPSINYNKIPQGLVPLMSYHHHHQYFVETDHSNKPSLHHFHNRSPSEDFLPHHLYVQSDMNSDRPRLKERALSDSRLQEHDETPKYYMEEAISPLSTWIDSNCPHEPVMWQGLMNEKCEADKHDNQCTFNTPEKIDLNKELLKRVDSRVTCSDGGRKQCEGNILNNDSIECIDLLKTDHLPSVQRHQKDSLASKRMVCTNQVNVLENSVDNMREHLQDCQLGTATPTPLLHFGNQNATEDQQCSMTQRKNGQKPSGWLRGYQNPPPCDQKPKAQDSKSAKNAATSRMFYLYDEDPVDCRDDKVEIENNGFRRQAYDEPMIKNAPQRLDYPHGNEESVVIVEDVTGTTPPDIPLALRVVPHVEQEAADEFPDHRDSETESTIQGSEYEHSNVDGRNTEESISDAAMAEMEAGIYGLQIIKNVDIEELKELGSGTFGTVYYGKWRGTDVAIKRIKKSCFSGRSSEQERLIKDFWREAQILSNLHHPNVVAFYGVVPDGPGGTMATVTEYMVNGSLRHVLQKKDKALDRRKKLMIALDAAFGMEYLHLKDIVHFDLKCDNLLVNLRDSQRPICKVGDFGLSRIKRNTLVSGGVRGTLPWMAPELLDGSSNRVSEKVDVYSFGIAMWEILTGEEPYANMHCGAIIGGIVSNTLRPQIPEDCDSEWKKLMEECWSFNPAARPSFTEITNRLRFMSMALQPKRRNLANK